MNAEIINKAKLIVTPNAYKESVLFSYKGDDLPWIRPFVADRINEQGDLQTMGVNVPTIDYRDGDCPVILVSEDDEVVTNTIDVDKLLIREENTYYLIDNSPDEVVIPEGRYDLIIDMSDLSNEEKQILIGDRTFLNYPLQLIWILSDGNWNDTRIWRDESFWVD